MTKTKSNPASTKEAGLLQVSETLRSHLILLLSCCIEAELLQHGFIQECCGLLDSDQIVRQQRVLDLDGNRAVVDALLVAVQTLDVRIDAGILAVNVINSLFRGFYALLDPRSWLSVISWRDTHSTFFIVFTSCCCVVWFLCMV